MKLTQKQHAFCREYLLDLNSAAAARRAGYSKRTCRAIGCENLTKPYIQNQIHRLLNERAERLELSGDDVVRRLNEVAERCMREETYDAGAAIRALELLGKHLGIFDKDNQQSRDIQIELVQYGTGMNWRKPVEFESTEIHPELTENLMERKINKS